MPKAIVYHNRVRNLGIFYISVKSPYFHLPSNSNPIHYYHIMLTLNIIIKFPFFKPPSFRSPELYPTLICLLQIGLATHVATYSKISMSFSKKMSCFILKKLTHHFSWDGRSVLYGILRIMPWLVLTVSSVIRTIVIGL